MDINLLPKERIAEINAFLTILTEEENDEDGNMHTTHKLDQQMDTNKSLPTLIV